MLKRRSLLASLAASLGLSMVARAASPAAPAPFEPHFASGPYDVIEGEGLVEGEVGELAREAIEGRGRVNAIEVALDVEGQASKPGPCVFAPGQLLVAYAEVKRGGKGRASVKLTLLYKADGWNASRDEHGRPILLMPAPYAPSPMTLVHRMKAAKVRFSSTFTSHAYRRHRHALLDVASRHYADVAEDLALVAEANGRTLKGARMELVGEDKVLFRLDLGGSHANLILDEVEIRKAVSHGWEGDPLLVDALRAFLKHSKRSTSK